MDNSVPLFIYTQQPLRPPSLFPTPHRYRLCSLPNSQMDGGGWGERGVWAGQW